ncbi:MAG TPA: DUF6603 domain-containing protein, partial [Candidatus Limnocylindria bacterium]|nr:DUF6603 domain-containing protein [Candidatus Limnocylindria bacterium]
MPGTAEALALELGRLLEPLDRRLSSPQEIERLFNDLGLPLPPEVRDAPDVVAAVGAAASAIGGLALKVEALVAAIASGNEDAVATAFGDLLPDARDAFTRAKDVGATVKAAYERRGGIAAELQAIVDELPARLVDYLIVAYFEGYRPGLARALSLLGVVESIPEPANGVRPTYTRRDVRFDHLADLVDDPGAHLQALYGWGAADVDDALLFGRLRDMLDSLGVPATVDPAAHEPRAALLVLREVAGTPAVLELLLGVGDLTGANVTIPIGRSGRWQVRVTARGAANVSGGLRIAPVLTMTPVAPGVAADARLTFAVERVTAPGATAVLFGETGGTRLEARTVRAGLAAHFEADGTTVRARAVTDTAVEDGRLVVSFAGADSFLASFLAGETSLDLDLGVTYDEERGLTFRGGAGLALTIPLGVDIGPARLEKIDLLLSLDATALALQATTTGSIALGPFAASVDGVGAAADLLFRDGNLGPVDLEFRFVPPTGLGLAIEAGPVRGGGFIRFDEPNGRYAGVFEVSVGVIGITAIGLLDTRLPGGQQGFALLVLLRGEFPPIQIGFGFAISSIGGLLALNRRFDVDALRARFATGTAGRILAPEDPVRNAPVLIADLGAVFPPAAGIVVVGPTLQLSWVEIVRLDIGIFVELPLVRIILLGSARAGVPNPAGGRPLAQLRVDILGLIDFNRQVMEFDAVLVDSHLLEIFELTGGAAFRLSWGADPYVVLAIGGFHPAWSPAPLVFPPSLTRIASVRGAPNDPLYLRLEGYFAITTNTLQFGAATELIVNAGPINARGFIGFDALIRFEPFYFQVDFAA